MFKKLSYGLLGFALGTIATLTTINRCLAAKERQDDLLDQILSKELPTQVIKEVHVFRCYPEGPWCLYDPDGRILTTGEGEVQRYSTELIVDTLNEVLFGGDGTPTTYERYLLREETIDRKDKELRADLSNIEPPVVEERSVS